MAASERAIRRNAELLRQGKIRNKARGAARNAYIDWDVTGKIRGEEDGPLTPGDGLPLGGLIRGGEGYGVYGGTTELKNSIKPPVKIRKEKIITSHIWCKSVTTNIITTITINHFVIKRCFYI